MENKDVELSAVFIGLDKVWDSFNKYLDNIIDNNSKLKNKKEVNNEYNRKYK